MYIRQLLCIFPCLGGIFALPSPEASDQATYQGIGSSFGVAGVDASFDYVVVGGGTAGLVMAARLAEDSSVSVAVIEAGGFYEVDNGNISVIPAEAATFAGTDPSDTNPLVDWGFITEPQKGANNRRMHYARGKTLGGTSARNYMIYQRPTFDTFKRWVAEVGDSSYAFSKLLPYYKKSVHYTQPRTEFWANSSFMQDPSAFSQSGGPLQVSFDNSYLDAFATWAQLAFKALGFPEIDGFSTGRLLGSAYIPSTIDPTNAHRSSSESSFLQSALKHTTLKVYKRTLAQKIVFGKNNRAKGVLVSSQESNGKDNHVFTLKARKEIIISAGAFQSPQLLMVSGIGPKETLQSLNIPVLKDLKGVGQNLWDHVWFGISYRVNVPTASALQNNPALLNEAIESYSKSANGPLSVFGGGLLGWEKLPDLYREHLSAPTKKSLSTFPADWPELEWLPVNAYLGDSKKPSTGDPRDGYNYATIAVALVAPLSRGNISINSRSMEDPPLINPNFITDPADVELAIAGFKRSRQFWSVLQSLNLTIGDEQFPGPSVKSDAAILEFIRSTLAPVWHPSSTCKMGRRSDPLAVIDSSARVYGTQGLRVVDASSFPVLPPGHPQSTVYMLAEKIASEILKGGGKH